MDDKLLTSLGMNAKELKLYKAVMRAREISPAELARAVKIKRTTCYSMARGLVEKGFLVENGTKRPRTFSLASAADIESVITDEKRGLATREKVLKQFASELSRATADESYPVPKIRFVEEEKLGQFLSKQWGVWNKNMLKSDPTWWGFQDHTYVDVFGKEIGPYWEHTPSSITLKLLSNEIASEREAQLEKKYPRREIKYWDKATNFLSSTWIVGDYVIMLNTRRHPYYLTEIHDAALANDMREVFKNLWALI